MAIIAAQGIQHLSLSAIEERAGMSRGQLTYYFPTKEAILLAVFDHMIEMMRQNEQSGEGKPGCPMHGAPGWDHLRAVLTHLIVQPPDAPEFYPLQFTFLSQLSHRPDFRERLASLYEYWRTLGAGDFEREMPPPTGRPPFSSRTLASFMQAVLHGLAIQRVADPDAYDPQEMLGLTLHLLGGYLGKDSPPVAERPERPKKRTPSRSRKKE